MLSVDIEAARLKYIALAHKLLERALHAPPAELAEPRRQPTPEEVREMDRHLAEMEAERDELLRQAAREQAQRMYRRTGRASFEQEG